GRRASKRLEPGAARCGRAQGPRRAMRVAAREPRAGQGGGAGRRRQGVARPGAVSRRRASSTFAAPGARSAEGGARVPALRVEPGDLLALSLGRLAPGIARSKPRADGPAPSSSATLPAARPSVARCRRRAGRPRAARPWRPRTCSFLHELTPRGGLFGEARADGNALVAPERSLRACACRAG